MMVKDVQFERKFLRHSNHKNDYHVYTGMNTIPDKPESNIPESIIKLLYRIHTELKKVDNE